MQAGDEEGQMDTETVKEACALQVTGWLRTEQRQGRVCRPLQDLFSVLIH